MGLNLRKCFAIIATIILLVGCMSRQESRQAENDTTRCNAKGIGAKTELSVYDRLVRELDSTEIYNDTIIYGYWFKPHEANAFNVFFHKNHTFEFRYYDNTDESDILDVVSNGEFTINGDTIIMQTVMEENGQAVSLTMIHKWNGTNYYLTDEGGKTYLVKGSDYRK